MAKNNKKPKEAESVVKYDQLGEVVANSCLGKRPVGPSGDLQTINIESLIHIIRGQKVMFDSDLAMLYGVETRTLNQAVKRNITRFPDDFMFQVTKEEWNSLRSQIVTLEDLKSQNVISNSVDEEENERLTSQNVIQKNHDRFLIVDDDVFLLGASVKDMGAGMCAVTKMQVSPELILGLLK